MRVKCKYSPQDKYYVNLYWTIDIQQRSSMQNFHDTLPLCSLYRLISYYIVSLIPRKMKNDGEKNVLRIFSMSRRAVPWIIKHVRARKTPYFISLFTFLSSHLYNNVIHVDYNLLYLLWLQNKANILYDRFSFFSFLFIMYFRLLFLCSWGGYEMS